MIHLPLICSSEFIKAFRIPRSEPRIQLSARESGRPPEPPADQGSSPGAVTFKCMGKKNPGAHQAHHRCKCLNHRTSPLRPLHPHRTTAPLHSQKDSWGEIEDRGRVMIWCNRLSESGTEPSQTAHHLPAIRGWTPVIRRMRQATIDSPRRS